MNDFYILVVRIFLGVFFAVILTRVFYPDVALVYVIGTAFFLVGMAYFFEYLRNKKTKL